MANIFDRIGDYVRGDVDVGRQVDSAVSVTGEQRRKLIEQQKRGVAFTNAFNRFKTYGNSRYGNGARPGLDPMYGPNQMGQDVSYLRNEALKVAMVNPHANRIVDILTNWTIMSGINITIKGRTKSLTKLAQGITDQYLYKSNDCDSTRHGDYLTFERLVCGYYFRAGEVLVRALPRKFSDGLALPLTFQVIDPSFLFDGMTPAGVIAGNTFAAGIEFSSQGHPEAYWLYKGDPRNQLLDRTPVRVPVKDDTGQVQITHLFDKIFPGQIRGIPRFVLVLAVIYEQQDLRYSVLRRFRMEAKISMVLKEGAEAVSNPTVPGLQGVSAPPGPAEDGPSITDVMEFFEDGLLRDATVLPLPKGWGVDQIVMQASNGYKDFMADCMRTMAAGCGVPYSALTTDLTQVSFSGGQLGLLDFKSSRVSDQGYFKGQLHRFVWSNINTTAIRAAKWPERIDADFNYDAFPSPSPDKDQAVIKDRFVMGIISPQRAAAKYGEDIFEIVDEIAVYNEYVTSKGLPYLATDQLQDKILKYVVPVPAADPAAGDPAADGSAKPTAGDGSDA